MDPILYNRLRWRCHRGMLELDILLLQFIDACHDELSETEVKEFTRLLQCQDPELLDYLMGHKLMEDKGLAAIVEKIRQFNQA